MIFLKEYFWLLFIPGVPPKTKVAKHLKIFRYKQIFQVPKTTDKISHMASFSKFQIEFLFQLFFYNKQGFGATPFWLANFQGFGTNPVWLLSLSPIKDGQVRASEAIERLRLSCLDNRENGGLPHFFTVLEAFWDKPVEARILWAKFWNFWFWQPTVRASLCTSFRFFPKFLRKK